MDPNAPLLLVGARYASRDDAVHGFERLWAARHKGKYDHVSVAVLTKDATGELAVERHDSTTRHAAWGGAVLGAALVIVAPPAGLAAIAVGTGGWPPSAGSWATSGTPSRGRTSRR